MEATILNFRRGRHVQHPNQVILKIDGITSIKEAGALLNKTVIWTSPAGKAIKGIIKASHGNRGCVRAALEKGLPGQALGQKIKIQ